jgi:hypothetical protein
MQTQETTLQSSCCILTATEMLLYSLLALSRLCCMTALDSTVEPSGSVAIWCCFRLAANASTSSLQQQQQASGKHEFSRPSGWLISKQTA